MLLWVHSALIEAGFAESQAKKVELAVEEAIVNIVHHAYQDGAGDIDMELLTIPHKSFTLILTDQGPPFNPLERNSQPIDPEAELFELEEGGLGIFFIKKYMDQILYERKEDKNVLTLIKKIDH